MDLKRSLRAFDHFQQGRKWLAIPLAVVKKFGNDQAGNLAALVAYYAFFSLFPLLLVFTTLLGFVLADHPSVRQSVEDSVLKQFPVIGEKIGLHSLSGSVVALVIGLLTSLWAGLGVTQAAQNALDHIWAVPFKHRPSFIKARLRGLGLLAVLGVLFLLSTIVSGAVSGGLGGVAAKVAAIVVSLLLNLGLFFVSFRLMTSSTVRSRELWLGAVLAAIAWLILQLVGGYYIGHILKNSSSTYGNFAFVIALLIWLHLGAQITLYCAEVNVVVSRRLWPRSLMGPPDAPADREALSALAKVEERSAEQRVEVEFDGDDSADRGQSSQPARTD
jgi:membrane protein